MSQPGQPADGVPPVRQDVTATGGFAYGVVGADVHVFGDGTPVYLLTTHRPAEAPDSGWLRELPSRMLNARYAVVGFTGRHSELDELVAWRELDGSVRSRLSVRWLHGPGGQGKTRLADQFAANSAAAGWKVITATHGPGSVVPQPGSQDLRAGGAAGVVLVVDYADRWPPSHLAWLLSNAVLHQPDAPARVLLLARTAYGFPALRAALGDKASVSQQHLLGLPDDHGAREVMFTTARDAFAGHYGIDDPGVVQVHGSLSDPDMGLILTVHMAALVAVDAHVYGRRPPADMAGLTGYLLDRERAHWQHLYDNSTDHGRPGRLDYATPPSVMAKTVFTAALTGPLTHPAGKTILDSLDLETHPDRVLADHAACYPPPDPVLSTVLEPLYPDRLAEDYLALSVPGHHSDHPAHPWAVSTATTLLSPNSGNTWPQWAARAVTFLAAAAARWPHLGNNYLYPLLHHHPELAIYAGSPTLTTLANTPHLHTPLLEAIEPLLPDGRHVDLDIGAVAITERLTQHRLTHTTNPATHAQLYDTLSRRRHYAGQHHKALTATEQAVTIYRRLAKANPAAYLPNLAGALNNLGGRLSEVGRREDALAPAKEAVDLYQRLAKANPAAYLPNLAGALNNLGGRLSEVGRREDALAPVEEAVDLCRRLAKANPAAYLPNLAQALGDVGTMLSEVGRREDALAPAKEAVDLYQRLAKANPAAYLPHLAMALNNLGLRLSEVGRREDALAPTEEAVAIHRQLAKINPAAYMPDLARALNNLGIMLSDVGRREDALAPAKEAVDLYQQLAKTNPAAYMPDLAAALNNLGLRLSEVGRREDALAPTEEAVAIRRRLAKINPAAYMPDLAGALSNLGGRLSDVGRREDALAPTEEAVAIRRRLVGINPAAYMPDLAGALSNLGGRLSEVGRREDALAPAKEAVDLYQQLAKINPAAYMPDLAGALNNLGIMLSEVGRREDALAPAKEAVDLYQQLAKTNPAAYMPDLAAALNNLGGRLSDVGRREDALAPTEEAVAIHRRLAKTNPAAYMPDLAAALNNLGGRLSDVGRREDALAPVEEALDLYRRLAGINPAVYLPDVAMALTNLGGRLSGVGRREDALAPVGEAVAIRRGLAKTNPAAYLADLAATLTNLGIMLSEVGRREDALAATEEAVGAYRWIADTISDPHLPGLAMALRVFASVRAVGALDLPRALEAVSEAIDIYQPLFESEPAMFAEAAWSAYHTAADILDALGRTQEAIELRRQLNPPPNEGLSE